MLSVHHVVISGNLECDGASAEHAILFPELSKFRISALTLIILAASVLAGHKQQMYSA